MSMQTTGAVLTKLSENDESASAYVKLNVGGSLFYAHTATLIRDSEWFRAMLNGRQQVRADAEGWILIDRCGEHFGTLLTYLRDGAVPLPNKRRPLMELLQESRFYCIESLTQKVQHKLTALQQTADQCSFYPRDLSTIVIVKSLELEKALLNGVKKPIVKLKMNRSNNVFSYTTNSHDILLRHIECLEKYALMFAHTVLFIRDIRNDKNEVCEWSFYYRGLLMKKIDCSSIHYSTDARLTKVEFPESKIHEEMLFVISLASRNVSHHELMSIHLRKQNVTLSPTGLSVAESHSPDQVSDDPSSLLLALPESEQSLRYLSSRDSVAEENNAHQHHHHPPPNHHLHYSQQQQTGMGALSHSSSSQPSGAGSRSASSHNTISTTAGSGTSMIASGSSSSSSAAAAATVGAPVMHKRKLFPPRFH